MCYFCLFYFYLSSPPSLSLFLSFCLLSLSFSLAVLHFIALPLLQFSSIRLQSACSLLFPCSHSHSHSHILFRLAVYQLLSSYPLLFLHLPMCLLPCLCLTCLYLSRFGALYLCDFCRLVAPKTLLRFLYMPL